MMKADLIREMIQAAINAGLSVREIIHEPDGMVRVLTDRQGNAPILDPLAEARANRAAKGKANVDRHKEAS